jgi:hypothetical protein
MNVFGALARRANALENRHETAARGRRAVAGEGAAF